MEREFVPYELAVKMKELGFEQPCLGIYNPSSSINFLSFGQYNCQYPVSTLAPLWQQAFDWFREKHNMLANVYSNASGYLYEMHDAIGGTHRLSFDDESGDCEMSGMFTTYEKARTALLEKLIELTHN